MKKPPKMPEMVTKTFIQNYEDDGLPTSFAFMIADSVGVIPAAITERPTYDTSRLDAELRLKNFQQMAITCSLQDSMIAFYGFSFDEAQMKALEVIYKSTKPWLCGAVVGKLIERINNQKITNKDFALSVAAIMEQIANTDGDGNQTATTRVKQLVYEFADLKTVHEKGKL